MNISGVTGVYGLIGDPVAHSLSPFIMNRAFAEHGIDAVYAAFPVTPERAGRALAGLKALGVLGVNVTFPLKESVIPYVDSMTPAAEAIGAVNLLRFGAGGTEADNTDAPGTAAALRDIAGVPFAGKRVFVLGAGGSGRAAAYGLLKEGAGEVIFGVRNPEKSKDIVGRFRRSLPNDQIETLDLGASNAREQLEKRLAEVDIIINATPAGMTGHGEGPLIDAGSAIHNRHCCFDFVYQQRETPFLKTARRGGAKTVEGLALLVAQAQAAFKVWTGVEFSLRDMFEATARHAEDFESVRGA